MKHLSILGSTGSIGSQTLDVIREHKKEFKVKALTTNSNIELLKKQIQEFKPIAVSVMDEKKADILRENIDIEVYSGLNGLNKIAILDDADTVVNALVGSVGLLPTINAIKSKKNILLANKETLVTAGAIVMLEAKKNNIDLIPIDSEHNAMLQCIKGNKSEDLRKIIITCSGGPFNNLSAEELKNVTVRNTLMHPTWSMGEKITVDSATLMNKGFEVIEAHWLYGIPFENIEVVIHPESIVHSLLEFSDKSVIAQLSLPDMKLPIQYALSHPNRLANGFSSLDITKIGHLSFSKPDLHRFPCLKYAYDCGIQGGTLPTVLNAVNEIAVRYFLANKIRFLDIPSIIQRFIQSHKSIKNPSLEEIIEIDKRIKSDAENEILNDTYNCTA